MKKGRILILIIATIGLSNGGKGQNVSSLPIVPYFTKSTQKTFVLYLTGDGGENSFSRSLMEAVNSKGYPAVLFNSQKYFWSKKTPERTTLDVEKVIRYYQTRWKVKNIIIIGYSFGADVVPFISTRLSKDLFVSVRNIVLMSPSELTDFEVHVAQLFGKAKKSGSSVIAEINKLDQKPLLIIQGINEPEKIESTSLKVTYKLVGLKGGHRYASDTSEVADAIFDNLN
jgi:type IV secretory pathway VirJ component